MRHLWKAFAFMAFLASGSAGAANGCLNTDSLPAAPLPGDVSATFSGTSFGNGFSATIWRQECPSGYARVFIRVAPISTAPLICGGFAIVQGGKQFFTDLQPDPNSGATFCDTLLVPATFLLVHNSYDPTLTWDAGSALTLYFIGSTTVSVDLGTESTPVGIMPTPGLWWNPAESGTGYSLDVRHGVLVLLIYSYTPAGASQWYIATGPVVNGSFFGTLQKAAGGQCISCGYQAPIANGDDGQVSISFASATSGTMTLPGRSIHIELQAF